MKFTQQSRLRTICRATIGSENLNLRVNISDSNKVRVSISKLEDAIVRPYSARFTVVVVSVLGVTAACSEESGSTVLSASSPIEYGLPDDTPDLANNTNEVPTVFENSAQGPQGAYWETQKWFQGDFNGDGFEDLGKAFNDSDATSIDVHLSMPSDDGRKFKLERWITRDTSGKAFDNSDKWLVGDFDGNGRDDLARISEGEISIFFSQVNTSGGSFLSAVGVKTGLNKISPDSIWLTGKFYGSKQDQLARVVGQETEMFYLYGGDKFAKEVWPNFGNMGQLSGGDKFLTGDFNADGKDDIARVYDDASMASIGVLQSTGKDHFNYGEYARQQGGYWEEQRWFVGDFNGDGFDDLGKVFNDGQLSSVDVHEYKANLFEIRRLFTGDSPYLGNDRWFAGSFDGEATHRIAQVYRRKNEARIRVSRVQN